MKTVHEILEDKGWDVWGIEPTATVREALAQMAEKGVGALVVTDSGKVLGVMSERDYARKVIMKGRSSLDTSVEDIMTPEPICVSPAQTIDECMAIMAEKHVRHLPVLEGSGLVGVLSIGDVVKSIIRAQETKIDELEQYIQGF